MKRRFSKIASVAAVLCAIVTVMLTVIPLTVEQRAMISQRDKLIHATVFALLTVCVAWALAGFVQSRLRVLTLTAIPTLVFASIDELAQKFVPTRTVDLHDWLANCVGITIGLIVYTLSAGLVGAFVGKDNSDIGQSLEE